ncbi:ABC transporter substrate-binding protein [Amycolatopsis sp. NEAU-NG30]|uniref:ABC transporter substrate-binding protein n=1 Tax=Amycolatopsis melonis TaxID=3156488 RepID=A0ABV0LBP9_9PSEU
MRNRREPSDAGEERIDHNDLEARLADLRHAMYESSLRRNDPGRQERFLARLFGDELPADTFASVVEARELGHDRDRPPDQAGGGVFRTRRHWPAVAAAVAAVAILVAGCLYFFQRGRDSVPVADPPFVTVRIGLLDVVDTAPLYRALQRGYFAEEKIHLEIEKFRGGPDAIAQLASGRLDIAFTSYPGAFTAQARGIAQVKIVAAAYVARNGHLMMMGAPGGGFTEGNQIAGKRIGVVSTGSISDIGTTEALRGYHVDPATIRWVPMSMDAMIGALMRGEIDGAVLAEPFVTKAEKAGAVPIFDVTVGRNAHLPLSGWFSTAEETGREPTVIAAFQRALARGVADVQNRAVLNSVLVESLGVAPGDVDDVRIATYPPVIDVDGMQKVADTMKDLGFVKERLDVRDMLLAPPGG